VVTDPNIYIPSESPEREFIYNNETQELIYQVPVAFTRYNIKKNADDLYTDDPTKYFTYSGGWNVTTVAKEKDGRYKNVSLKAYSGDSFKFYFNVGDSIAESGIYLSGPVTTSGVYKTFTAYSGEASALANAITFSAPTDNSSVFTMPSVETLRYMRLYHTPATSGTTYRLYQFLPRTLIQVDDLEADVIDTVTLRVSDSIVIGPNLIGDKTILGQKIVDGTVSGVLITDGTITGSKVVARTISGVLITAGTIKGENIEAATISGTLITAGTITGDKIQANTISGVLITASSITSERLFISQLDAIAGKMGTLTVNSGISVDTNGKITAGKTVIDNTGITVGNFSTATVGNTDAIQIIGSGTSGNIVGLAMYNADFSTNLNNPLASIRIDGTNAIEIDNNNGTNNAVTNFNFADNSTGALNIYNADLNMYRKPSNVPSGNVVPGAIRGYDDGGDLIYELGYDWFALLTESGRDVFRISATTGDTSVSGTMTVAGVANFADNFNINTNKFSVTAANGNTDIRGNVTVSGGLTVAGVTNIASDVNVNTNKVSITASTGDTDIRGNVTVSGSISHRDIGFISRTTNQSVNAGTSAQMQLNVANTGNITGNTSTYNVTVLNTGFFLVNASVSSATTNLPWRVNQNGSSYTTGTTVLANLTFSDGREVGSRIVYLTSGNTLGLYINNTSAGAVNFTGTLRVARLT
jgi:hypothetical protein